MSHRCERAMLLLLHETSQGTFSHVFDRDSTDLDDVEKDIGDYSSKGKRKHDVDDNGISNDYLNLSHQGNTVLYNFLLFVFKILIYFFVYQ